MGLAEGARFYGQIVQHMDRVGLPVADEDEAEGLRDLRGRVFGLGGRSGCRTLRACGGRVRRSRLSARAEQRDRRTQCSIQSITGERKPL